MQDPKVENLNSLYENLGILSDQMHSMLHVFLNPCCEKREEIVPLTRDLIRIQALSFQVPNLSNNSIERSNEWIKVLKARGDKKMQGLEVWKH